MSALDDDKQENEVAEQAVQALTAAHRRALAAGHSLVLVKDGCLVRIESGETKMLKRLPSRIKMSVRTKSARS